MAVPECITAWQMDSPGSPLVSRDLPVPSLGDDDVLIQIAGCGLCHTDLSFLYGGVNTKKAPPLTLGHEFSGVVVDAGAQARQWMDKSVIVPAVLPCGSCALCQAGRGNACRAQVMPGNDIDGGFATHAVVPAQHLCAVEGSSLDLWELGVVADAVTTPYQAAKRAQVTQGDAVIILGVGGIGTYGVQICAALGAEVLAIDVDEEKLNRISQHGASHVLNTKGMEPREIKKAVREVMGKRNWGWKVFEMSGTAAGQAAAFELLSFAGTVGFIGFSPEKIPVRLGNLMAFDATVFGNWGCHPSLYPEVLAMVEKGSITLKPFVKQFPLDSINQVLEAARNHELVERAVLVP